MNAMKKLTCMLLAGATLGAAAPVFAHGDRDHDYYREHQRYYGDYRPAYRDYGRYYYEPRPYVIVRPPVVVPPPVVYYPAPVYGVGPATFIGALIGGMIDAQR